MKSFALLRTNVALTSNVKLMVDSNYSLYMESIDSADELSISSLKNVQFNKDNFWDELLPNFYKNFPVDVAFSINYDNDVDNMSNSYSEQYDEMYIAGAKNIINNKNYKEEYEYFAPLYVFKNKLPKYFTIFRIDGPGLVNMNKDNFRTEFLNKFKSVKVFDLTKNTPIGEFIDRNWKINENFPNTGLDVDFRELEFTRWIGIDYVSGGYTHKSLYMDEELEKESTLFDLEQLITDGYRVNKIVHPNLINLTFLFDDTPSTPDTLRKWSLNRYSGFYIDDMEEYDKIHPFKLPELQSDVIIVDGNRILSQSKSDPFTKGFKDDDTMWVEYLGDFYRVEKYDRQLSKRVSGMKSGARKKQVTIDEVEDPTEISYRIISDINLQGKQSQLNKRHCYIDDQGRIINSLTESPYIIDNYTYSDVTLINIDGVYHNIIFENGYYKLNTDYGFTYSDGYRLTYYTNSGLDGFTNYIDLSITSDNTPSNFPIYRLKFTDVKDFDTNIIDNEFSKFEYIKRNKLTRTEEPKLYLTDLRNNSTPPPFDDFIFEGVTEYIPVASDYTANLETFQLNDNSLSQLWRKSPVHLRWGYQNSLSAHDYPYLLNNTDLLGVFNQTVNTREMTPIRSERNLDYFYTINSGTTSYIHHTLHIESNSGTTQDQTYKFKLDDYLNLSTYSYFGNTFSYEFDYFDLFFSQTQSFLDGDIIKNAKKYSYFEVGDNSIPNTTVFKGMKFKIFEVDSIIKDSASIKNLNLFSSNTFEDYKFSILLSSNDKGVSNDGTLYDTCELGTFESATSLGGGSTQFLVSTVATPSLSVGDVVELDFPLNQLTLADVTYVGAVSGGYGFNATTGYNTSQASSGVWRSKMQWKRIYNFEHDRAYLIDDIVMYEDKTYRVTSDVTVTNPSENPQLNTNFTNFTSLGYHPFWQGVYATVYSANTDWVFIYDEYYIRMSGPGYPTSTDFWDNAVSYNTGEIVNYQNRFYKASQNVPMGIRPVVSNRKISVNYDGVKYWNEITSSQVTNFLWSRIPLWDVNETVSSGRKRVYEGTLYENNAVCDGEDVPGVSSIWERVYSFEPDTEYNYSPVHNEIIKMDNWFYLNTFNPGHVTGFGTSSVGNYTLDNGITIYIHKPSQNILVNIAINDNTLESVDKTIDETRNIERDQLYVKPNSRITAANFIRQINDLDTLYGFADYTSYVVVDDDFTISKYKFDNNLENLPYFLLVEEADEFSIDNSSLSFKSNGLPKNVLKSFRYLENGNIDQLEKINYYNENPIAYTIDNVKDETPVTKNLNSQKTNDTTTSLFRHSGYYMPLVYDVQLFRDSSIYDFVECSESSCPVITWNWRYEDDPNLYYGVSYSTTPIPLFYIGDDSLGRPQYSGVFGMNGFININLYYENTRWELYWTSGTYSANVMFGDSLLGTYSWTGNSLFNPTQSQFYDTNIVCGDQSDSWTITQQPSGSTTSNTYTAYATYNDTEYPISYMIFPNLMGGSWSTQSSHWDFTLSGCSFTNNSPQSSLIEGTFSNLCGTVSFTQGLDPYNFDIDFIDPCAKKLVMRQGNYTFDTNLSLFGVKQQRVIQKVNENENVLKLKNNDSFGSIYPMLDEFGYMVADFFIFKSTWDFLYHYKTNNPKVSSAPSQQNIFRTLYLQQIIKKYNNI